MFVSWRKYFYIFENFKKFENHEIYKNRKWYCNNDYFFFQTKSFQIEFRKSKIMFLQDETIFFLLIFLSVLVCTSSIQKVHLGHPQRLQSDYKQQPIMCF